jgi:hypothetical protein
VPVRAHLGRPSSRVCLIISIVRAGGRTLLVSAVLALAATGCSSGGLPDPFKDGLSHARVVIDRVDCDPTPDLCTRYLVLRPVGISTTALISAAEDRARSSMHWRPTRYPEVVEYDMGIGFDGPKKHSPAGMINTAVQELHYWRRVGMTTGTPPPTTMLAVQRAMEATRDGVVVTISGG